MSNSVEKSEALSLTFDPQNDPLDFGRNSLQSGNDWLSGKPLNLAKGYEEGEFEIVLEFSTGTDNSKYHLVFLAIPFGNRNISRPNRAGSERSKSIRTSADAGGCINDRNKESMEALAPNSIQCHETIIPSRVRLERAKDRQDIRRAILQTTPHGILKFSGVIRDGKLDAIESSYTACGCNSVSGLVEAGSKGVESLIGSISDDLGNLPPEFDLVRLADAIRVGLNNAHVRFVIDETLAAGINSSDVLLCAREAPFGA